MNEPGGLFSDKSKPVPLMGVAVSGDVQGRGARVKVSQRYRNTENTPIEAIYKFPLPEGSAICGFNARVDGRVIHGQVEEWEKAFEMYDKALEKGFGGFLMDEERPNIFTLSVGNLKPGTETVIEISLVMLLDLEGDNLRFFLPTTISPRYTPEDMEERDGIPESERINPPFALEVPYGLSLALNIHHPDLLSSVESPTHPIKVNFGNDPVRVNFSNETVLMDRDFVMYIGLKSNSFNRAYHYRAGDFAYLQLDLLLNREEESKKEEDRKEIIFLLDCSGSMQGDSIREAKKALEICLRALRSDTSFNIFRFGSSFTTLFRHSKPYSAKTLDKAINYIKSIEADLGGTELLKPLKNICSSRPEEKSRLILLLTDGEVGNEEEIMELAGSNAPQTRLFSVGIGAGPNEYLIKGLARTSKGAWEFIAPGERIEPKVLRIFDKMNSPFLDSLTISWPGDSPIQSPERPTFFLNYPQTIFAQLRAEAVSTTPVRVKGLAGKEELVWDVEMVEACSEKNFIPILWAGERIRDLEESCGEMSGSRQRERKSQVWKDAVIDLSREFNLLSKYTSFVAVEEREEKDRTTDELVLRKVPAQLTTGWHGLRNNMPQFSARRVAKSASPFWFSKSVDYMADEVCESCELPVFSRRAIKAGVSDEKDKFSLVLTILAAQTAEGGLLLNKEISEAIGVNEREIRQYARDLKINLPVDPYLLLSTAILIAVLETHFTDQTNLWKGPIKKSQDWLTQIFMKGSPKIYDKALSAWTEEFVKDRIRLT
jgi:Ca-activated chloride channel homolog